MGKWISNSSVGLAVLLTMVATAGCGGSSPEPIPVRYGSLRGMAEVSGPIPVYYSLDSTSTLSAGVEIGLFTPGTNERLVDGSLGRVLNGDTGPNHGGNHSFYLEFSDSAVPPGRYDLAIYATGLMAVFPGYVYHQITPMAIQSRVPITIDYPIEGDSGVALKANFSGAGPYGSLSGRLLIDGNQQFANKPSIVLYPDSPAAGVDSETGLLWTFDTRNVQHGVFHFTVSGVAQGSYTVMFYGDSLLSSQSNTGGNTLDLELTPGQPDISDITFRLTNRQPFTRPYELGEINGTLLLPNATAPGQAFAVVAVREFQPEDDPSQVNNAYYRAVATFDHGGFVGGQPFMLGWLADGAYTISVYQLSDNIFVHDQLLLELGHQVVINAGSRIAEGILLEVK